jgi:hypothetical protein
MVVRKMMAYLHLRQIIKSFEFEVLGSLQKVHSVLRCDSSSKMKGGWKITLKAKFKKFKQDF